MSLIIHNGYQTNLTNIAQLHELVNTVRSSCQTIIHQKILHLFAKQTERLLDGHFMLSADLQPEDTAFLQPFHEESYQLLLNAYRAFRPTDKTASKIECLSNIGNLYLPLTILIKDHLRERIEDAEQREINNVYNFQNSLAAFSHPDGHTYLIFYGNEWNKQPLPIPAKEFSYDGRTDEPEFLTPEEWEHRRTVWNTLIPQSSYESGLCIGLADGTNEIIKLCIEPITHDMIQSYLHPVAERAETYAKRLVYRQAEQTLPDNTVNTILQFDKQFKQDIQNPHTEIGAAYEKAHQLFCQHLKDINDTHLQLPAASWSLPEIKYPSVNHTTK